MDNPRISVKALFPLPCNNVGISHICALVCRHMQCPQVAVELMAPRVGLGKGLPFIRPLMPRVSALIPFPMIRRRCIPALERWYLRRTGPGDIAYLWSDISLEMAWALKKAGILVLREKFNCHVATARRILDEAYARLGLPPGHGISDQAVAKEREELALADLVYCPSPMVSKSLSEEGVGREKLIGTSFGWDPDRFRGNGWKLPAADGITVLFVGAVCVRKGVHLLLEAWSRAGIKGRLILAGAVEPALAQRCAAQLNRSDVTTMGHVKDLRPYYRSADIFAFPSLEEGGPLVTYEAAAHALPMVLSPMGAGSFTLGDEHAIVLDPYAVDEWAEALRKLAASKELRVQYGAAARANAQQFTWEEVGWQRAQALVEKVRAMGGREAGARQRATDAGGAAGEPRARGSEMKAGRD